MSATDNKAASGKVADAAVVDLLRRFLTLGCPAVSPGVPPTCPLRLFLRAVSYCLRFRSYSCFRSSKQQRINVQVINLKSKFLLVK